MADLEICFQYNMRIDIVSLLFKSPNQSFIYNYLHPAQGDISNVQSEPLHKNQGYQNISDIKTNS